MFNTVFLIAWFTCGLIAGLAAYRWFQSENPSYADMDRPKDVGRAIVWFILGPLGLLETIFVGGFRHGLNPFRKP